VAKNESLQKRAHCDVGLKAIFRSIRRLCIDQLKSLKGIETTKEQHQHLADLIATRYGYTKSKEEIEDIAILMMAFDASNHNSTKRSYYGLNPSQ
jgi:hypothetical protein